ncbi:hypothetical protein I79_016085 [Cricetulus griseus]|uniref:Homeobox domain-containing protein n=1 Tax=Cricetulus griseus TaxID=10029 RepID=G3HYF7_CRIGR|nr:hypothetical protein I79_016085 [Cricetulus griseus]
MEEAPCSLSPDTLDTREEEYCLEQQRQLVEYFEKELYPDLEARRDLATRRQLTEKLVETWFIQHSMEKEMRQPLIQLTAGENSYPGLTTESKGTGCTGHSGPYPLTPQSPQPATNQKGKQLSKAIRKKGWKSVKVPATC